MAKVFDSCYKDITPHSSYEEQAVAISKVLKSNVMPVQKLLIPNAHDLFLIHRDLGPKYEGGITIRSTVQV